MILSIYISKTKNILTIRRVVLLDQNLKGDHIVNVISPTKNLVMTVVKLNYQNKCSHRNSMQKCNIVGMQVILRRLKWILKMLAHVDGSDVVLFGEVEVYSEHLSCILMPACVYLRETGVYKGLSLARFTQTRGLCLQTSYKSN